MILMIRARHQSVTYPSEELDSVESISEGRREYYGRCGSGWTYCLLLCIRLCPPSCKLQCPLTQYLTLELMFQSGKPQFSYIYGVGLLGTTAIYLLLNLMSESGIDAYRTASVLGYCLIPMIFLGSLGIGVGIDHPIGYFLSIISIVWCTHSASSIFVAVLRMDHQRLLVAYPVGLLYGCFALLSIFNVVPAKK